MLVGTAERGRPVVMNCSLTHVYQLSKTRHASHTYTHKAICALASCSATLSGFNCKYDCPRTRGQKDIALNMAPNAPLTGLECGSIKWLYSIFSASVSGRRRLARTWLRFWISPCSAVEDIDNGEEWKISAKRRTAERAERP
jgi:hypothetical protein